MGQKKRAWIYSRIDAPEDTHGLLKEQRKELYDYADQMDFEVVGSSKDIGSGLDAYSGLFGQYFREYPDNKTGYIRTPCHVL